METIETRTPDARSTPLRERLGAFTDNHEMISVVAYFLVVVGTSAMLAPMLGLAWESRGLTYLLVLVPVELGFVSLASFTVLLLGVWWGLVVLLLLFDTKKRLQGLFLVVGTLTALFGLCQFGLVCGNLNLLSNLEWLGAGLLVGVLLGGLRDMPGLLEGRKTEFRDAAQWVFYLGSLLVVAGFLEAHVQYPLPMIESSSVDSGVGLADPAGRNLLVDAALSGVFVVTLGRFIEYDAETNFFVLGPSQSGKSLLMLGAYYQATEGVTNEMDPVPNSELYHLLGEVDDKLMRMSGSGNSWWPIPGNDLDESARLGFEFVHGTAFPKNVEVQTVDYAGEWLSLVPDIITMDDAQLREYVDAEGFNVDAMEDIKHGVAAADVLVLTLDVEKHVTGQSLDIGTYHEIVEKTAGKTVLLVATKCDLLVEPFEQETGLDPYTAFDDFSEYVERTLTRREQVRSLVDRAAGSTVYPVWFETRPASYEADGDGVDGDEERIHRVPSLTADGHMVPVGFDRLLDYFGRGR
ncbi:hypothetical protein GJR96_06695 [Haloferax sp. MBLA0076]|uniref:Uncharacterized protein n=1 Tax=Haloferax litoreum TaxID=2666140 RepID=A0A6A8GET0_9EURY|nr:MULTISPECIES: hypothetical protein [Haloferax]KAB1193148.1 hypothetical protein Hfx1148_06685 [Haloferax sp. CBA1148]MRX21643.1 hypothetical protein [Haloferax litoreum]